MRAKSCGPWSAKTSFRKAIASSKWEAFRRSKRSLMMLLEAVSQAEHDQDGQYAAQGKRHATGAVQSRQTQGRAGAVDDAGFSPVPGPLSPPRP